MGMGTYGRGFTLANSEQNGMGASATGGSPPGQYTGEAGMYAYYEVQLYINYLRVALVIHFAIIYNYLLLLYSAGRCVNLVSFLAEKGMHGVAEPGCHSRVARRTQGALCLSWEHVVQL